MSTLRNYRWRALLCSGILVLGLSAAASQDDASLGFEALTLAVAVPDRSFLVLEPIPITLRIENRTDRAVAGHMALEFSATRLIRLVIRPQGLEGYEVADLSLLSASTDFTPRTIRPGETRAVGELIHVGLDRILPRPGRYDVQVVLHGFAWEEEIRSNIVSLELREPTGLEQAAQAYIQSTGAAGHFFYGIADAVQRAQVEEVATTFSGTAFADHANLALGDYSRVREDYDAARLYYSKVANKRDFPLADRAATALAELPTR
jgi:hypothetical protein